MTRALLFSIAAVAGAVAIGGATLDGAEVFRLRGAPAQDDARDSLPDHFGIGRAATAAELARIDDDVRADGRGLPAGSGTVTAGAKVYAAKCVACHGKNGEGIRQRTLQLGPKLIGRNPGDAFDFNQSTQKEGTKTIGNYWPYATTLFDYVRRAMPITNPLSLTNDEVYAVTAYVLALNGIVGEDAVMNAQSLPQVRMPNRDGFVSDWPPRER
ncbi:MAG TPA: cytochrome c [Burkholderiales bacterium]